VSRFAEGDKRTLDRLTQISVNNSWVTFIATLVDNRAMQTKGWKLWMIVAALAVIAVSLWIVHHQRDRREAAERETHYQATLTEYSANVKPGMTRERVEHYLRDEGKPFRQMCCVANFRHQYVSLEREGWDDLVKIAEESVPFVCTENNVYIAFEFNPKSQGEQANTNSSDILKKVSVFHELEGCI
jgi:hypothetical protein